MNIFLSKKMIVVSGLILIISAFSFSAERKPGNAENVKQWYITLVAELERNAVSLQQLSGNPNGAAFKTQLAQTRLAYKKAETFIEYYFSYFALKLNGPATEFFEEEESDMGQQQPAGMQLIEALVDPVWNKKNKPALDNAVKELISAIRALQTTTESTAFNDAFIFDAVTEELIRISTMGITGFDTPNPGNCLRECGSALEGLEKTLSFYKEEITNSSIEAGKVLPLLDGAMAYIRQHNNFNNFDRMLFLKNYMDPILVIITKYKMAKGFVENKSPLYYSTIKKSSSLFVPWAFDPNKYLDDNTTSPEKIILGKKLFFEKDLSTGSRNSCASCHDPARGFTDGLATSLSIDGHSSLPRNAPTLWNAALQRNLFLDNRSSSLEAQVMEVLNNAKEMSGSASPAAEKVLAKPGYDSIYARAYPGSKKADALPNICNAIACFERTLISLNSKFDRHMTGLGILTTQEVAGFNLFMGKAKCGTCHFMPLFSGAKPPRYYYNETEVIGVPDKNVNTGARLDEDPGRFAVTHLPIHRFAFKTSSLRNIAITAPYMHNGVFKTLDEVLDFYNRGGGKGFRIAPKNQTLSPDKLQLSPLEKKNIIAFLRCLTDTVQPRFVHD